MKRVTNAWGRRWQVAEVPYGGFRPGEVAQLDGYPHRYIGIIRTRVMVFEVLSHPYGGWAGPVYVLHVPGAFTRAVVAP